MVGTGRFELPTPRTPSECSTRLSHVPTAGNMYALCAHTWGQRLFYTRGDVPATSADLRLPQPLRNRNAESLLYCPGFLAAGALVAGFAEDPAGFAAAGLGAAEVGAATLDWAL